MHIETRTKNLSQLLDLYNKEIDTLKAKLLNGIPWEELAVTRKNITELAVAIHKSHGNTFSDDGNDTSENEAVEVAMYG